MKKIISVTLLLLMIFMLEFNWLEGVLPGIYIWVESILAIGVMISLIMWNDLIKRKS